ncbi:mitotic spindle checkpoint protein BUB3, WD repeat superfamily [Scheffersomyces coipomensis]|uniref:mitotic spindle checkpoint protein BUB3, WD repeat superfamily n=1 Tax=Scheffersomyces coipomensis TaxID=1788519 RepID=UPI00315D2F92
MALLIPRDHDILPHQDEVAATTENRPTDLTQISSQQLHHEFELSQSESLNFLYNLLYDDQSYLSKSDILRILNSIKTRENHLPFSIDASDYDHPQSSHNSTSTYFKTDLQGIHWPKDLRRRFFMDRSRVGKDNWFYNIPDSKSKAINQISIDSFDINTEFFKFYKFFGKLKLHLNHLQLRNLVCCGPNISNGIYYPSNYYHDYNLDIVHTEFNHPRSEEIDDNYHNFFKINRLMPDNATDISRTSSTKNTMKINCLIDSRSLLHNSNSRISTLSASDKFLVCGTFEGGYILGDVSDANSFKMVGEYHLTNNSDGITNHILINESDNELIISSNDKKLRIIDLSTNKSNQNIDFDFPVNGSAINHFNTNEIFISGDSKHSYIIDKRLSATTNQNFQKFIGHEDFGFCCDWSSQDENLLLTGNQDTCVKLWDRRNSSKSLYTWSGSLGSNCSTSGGPVRNCKFSHNGEFISWAEGLDHVGILQLNDLMTLNSDEKDEQPELSRIQSIDFIGKCTALSFSPIENGYGEQLIIGVDDCPLGGILSYKLESKQKPLDFDFYF